MMDRGRPVADNADQFVFETETEVETMPMLIQVTQLGLAAYIQMKGCKLLKVQGRSFHFESDKTISEWKVDYANSESSKHDALVCELRTHLNKSPA